jgi:hypothetical protein
MRNRRHSLSLRTIALVAALAAASMTQLGAATASAASPSGTLGVYRGAVNVDGVRQFEGWVPHSVPHVLDFLSKASWSKIESPTWWTSGWARTDYQVEYSVAMIPDTGGTLQAGARGDYNSHFLALAKNLVANGQADATVRLGWEFNGGWYKWSAKSDPAAFAAYWRQIVNTMRTVPGQSFKFDWCPSIGSSGWDGARAYPGDAYVDYIGMDFYDQSWISGWQDPVKRWDSYMNMPYGLKWHRDFAAAHGKQMTYPEWGLAIRDDGHGGGDNPYFIQQMHDWIAANNVAFHSYFEFDRADGEHSLMSGAFPRAADKFQQVFGSDAPDPPTDPPPTDPPPTDPPPTDTVIKNPRGRGHQKPAQKQPARRHLPRLWRRGSIRGEVVGATTGEVTIRLQYRARHRWRQLKTRTVTLEGTSTFEHPIRDFRNRRLSRGRYRVRASYSGSPEVGHSASRFRRFQIGR